MAALKPPFRASDMLSYYIQGKDYLKKYVEEFMILYLKIIQTISTKLFLNF